MRRSVVVAGATPCGQPMYACEGDRHVICRSSEHPEPVLYDLADHRAQLLGKVADQLAPAAQALHLLSLLGVPVTKVQVHRWAHGTEKNPERVRLWPHGQDASGRPLYRVREVRDLAVEHARRRDKRVAPKAS